VNEKERREGFVTGETSTRRNANACPYDGRTREGRAWWEGYFQGEQRRFAKESIERAGKEPANVDPHR